MAHDLINDLLQTLPAGEWTDVEPLRDDVGVMANRAVRARATWLRKQNMRVFLKCIPSRREEASDFTAILTDPARLEGIRLRLLRAQATNGPLVKIHYCDWIGDDDDHRWLVIAMDQVQPLADRLLTGGRDKSLAITVLRSLSVAKCAGWFHYDVCPSNTGIDAAGRVVFIDPESYLELRGSHANVSVGLAKWMRISPELRTALARIDETTAVPAALVEAKHNAEVALLAAECCLGCFNRLEFTEEYVREWCSEANGDSALRGFWLQHLLSTRSERPIDLDSIANALDRLETIPQAKQDTSRTEPSSQSAIGAPIDPDVHAPPARRQTDRTLSVGLPRADDDAFDVECLRTWEDFESIRRAVRERRVKRTQLRAYRERLEECAEAEPSRREWWSELLMLCLVFDVDPVEAARVAGAALTHFPGDEEFLHDRRVAERWPRG